MIFDPDNPPAVPDESLDPALAYEKSYTIEGRPTPMNIAPGDWVDVSPVGIGEDRQYGTSFQVCNTYDHCIGILFSHDDGETYGETILSLYWITNNYRKL